jgi:hypothetical protein
MKRRVWEASSCKRPKAFPLATRVTPPHPRHTTRRARTPTSSSTLKLHHFFEQGNRHTRTHAPTLSVMPKPAAAAVGRRRAAVAPPSTHRRPTRGALPADLVDEVGAFHKSADRLALDPEDDEEGSSDGDGLSDDDAGGGGPAAVLGIDADDETDGDEDDSSDGDGPSEDEEEGAGRLAQRELLF